MTIPTLLFFLLLPAAGEHKQQPAHSQQDIWPWGTVPPWRNANLPVITMQQLTNKSSFEKYKCRRYRLSEYCLYDPTDYVKMYGDVREMTHQQAFQANDALYTEESPKR
jgi:hypothetical protein